MNVLFIKPRSKHTLYVDILPEIDEGRGYFPPLGLMYVAAAVRAHTDAKVSILDMDVECMDLDQLNGVISRNKPDIVAIQSITYTIIDTILTAKKIREIDPSIKIVVGGIHATIYPRETINNHYIDYVINGEGELAFVKLIKNIENKEKLRKTRGVVFKDKGKIVDAGRADIIPDLNVLPFPARDLTSIKKYYSVLAKRAPLTTMITSKGCPNQCVFCDRPQLENRFRPRLPKSVVDEMEECNELGIYEFSLYDDTFTIDKKRAIDICDEIIKRKLDIGWDARARVNTVDKELLTKMKKAGCERLYFGVESGVPEILKAIKKNITLEQVQGAFKLAKKLKMQTLAYFMMGLPTETKSQVLKTIKFSKKLNADYVVFSIFTPLPCTESYYNYLENGTFKEDHWKKFAENPSLDFKPKVNEENMSLKELNALLKYAYKNYYLTPKYMLKRLLAIRSFEQFKTQFKTGLSLLKIK